MSARKLITLPLLALAACSTSGNGNGETTHSASRDKFVSTAPAYGSANTNKKSNSEDWRTARGTILRTFAFRALEKNLVHEAKNYLQEACEVDPTDTASHAALSRLFLVEGNKESALAYASRAYEYAPEDPEINVVFAAALAENDRSDEATVLLEKVWNVNAGDPGFSRALLTHYAASGDRAVAREFLDRIMAQDGIDAGGFALAGDMFLSDGDLEGAAEAYRKGLELNPNMQLSATIRDSLGFDSTTEDPMIASARRAEETGDVDGAERLYIFLARSQPESIAVKSGLARVLLAQGRAEEAWARLAGVPVGARTWRDHLLQARIDIEMGQWRSAHGALLFALNNRPGIRAAELLLHFIDGQLAAETKAAAIAEAAAMAETEAAANETVTPVETGPTVADDTEFFAEPAPGSFEESFNEAIDNGGEPLFDENIDPESFEFDANWDEMFEVDENGAATGTETAPDTGWTTEDDLEWTDEDLGTEDEEGTESSDTKPEGTVSKTGKAGN